MKDKVSIEFGKRFGADSRLYMSPGRVNLIGDHTDYNLGFVLPGAIDKGIYAAIRPNGKNYARLYSLDYDTELRMELDAEPPEPLWAKYIYGVVRELKERGVDVGGFDMAFGGDLPVGAGLSSSAALESVTGFALNEIFPGGLSLSALAEAGQLTEHKYIGVNCGIMDQFASLHGKAGHLIKLDCRDLTYRMIPMRHDGYRVVLLDSMVKHSLATTEYNVRRAQCEAGISVLSKYYPNISSLRDVTAGMLEQYGTEMDEIVLRRCRFVIDENRRVEDAAQALLSGELSAFGEAMFESHRGLSLDYEVSCPELDTLVCTARECDGVIGARMMGGGFGGCVISLVEEGHRETFIEKARERFHREYGHYPAVIDVAISDGARRIG